MTGCERCRSELLALCAEAGFAPDIAFASDDYVAVQSLVASGIGVTVLPGLALRAHRNPDVVRRPVPGAARRIQVTTYGAPPHPAAVDAVAPCWPRCHASERPASIAARLASRWAADVRLPHPSLVGGVLRLSGGTCRAAPAPSIATKTK